MTIYTIYGEIIKKVSGYSNDVLEKFKEMFPISKNWVPEFLE